MKHIRQLAAVLAIVLAPLLIPWPAIATDPLNDALAALKQAPVYVAIGTAGTDKDTAGILTRQLTDGDTIVLVMLPASSNTNDSALDFAKKLSDGLGSGRIIGLAIGSDVVAYAPQLPAGVPSDLMNRAVSVSTTTAETLGTFVRNVHDWQAAHPQPKPADASNQAKDSGLAWWLWLIIVLVLCGIGWFSYDRLWDKASRRQLKLRYSPRPVRNLLSSLLDLQPRIEDASVRADITQICKDIEYYFRRNRDVESSMLLHHLENVRKVLVQYIDIQDIPARYARNSQSLLDEGAQAIREFAQFILETARQNNGEPMAEFSVNTEILRAATL
jgi:hypothetical protein